MKRFQVQVAFAFSSGEPGGLCSTVVNGRKAAERQAQISVEWVRTVKRGTVTSVEITETTSGPTRGRSQN